MSKTTATVTTDSDDSATDDAIMNMLNPDDNASGQDADATDADSDDDSDDAESDGQDGADELGDKGKQALDRMKAKWRAERDARRALEQQIAARDTDSDATTTDRDAVAKANLRILKSEIKAAAAGRLADPKDAHLYLDLDDFEVDDDGNVDEDEIADAIETLLQKKPYLAAQSGPRKPKPDRSQGETGAGTASTAQQFAAALDRLI